uniref:Uncharacterized protein n=1 Tax=Chromera velia CCMP2878 TaxID=1169474 RepID=A0A0G4F7S9_9ALVE|eukprot:Cvel_15518.t1-p1 / transcript=Cvel_15518.t1 / gene=Cvel_15518 / organism=Chromera_velia_CCMP2878 / gene_product=hypothetical protein / transcript_product=hypothetical protein / location=Cvel_scaffold1152:41107-41886(+) / protein_length=99 / sequence_SO=supercontig / SO=protein_coding / is_pseudo=false
MLKMLRGQLCQPATAPITPPEEVGVVTPEEETVEELDKQNYGYVNGPWFDQRRQNYFNGGYTQNFNQWNGNNFGHIGTVFGGGYRGRRLQGEVEEEQIC